MAYLEHSLLFDTHDDIYFAIFNPYSLFSKEAEAEGNPEAEAEALHKIGPEADPEANLTSPSELFSIVIRYYICKNSYAQI